MIDHWRPDKMGWLGDLPAEAVDGLRKTSKIRHYRKGETVFEPRIAPQHVFVLATGLIRIYRESREAQVFTLGFVRPGEIFGECALFPPSPRESFAAAVEPSDVFIVNRQEFTNIIRKNPSIIFAIARQIETRFKNIESRAENLAFRDTRSRLAQIILQLGTDFGARENGHIVMGMRLTQAELATLIGASRPTVSIFLGEFEDEKMLTRKDGWMTIVDPAALEAAICG